MAADLQPFATPPDPEPGEYDRPIRLLHTRAEVVAVLARARAEFLARVQRQGLTVTREADARWWPIAEYRRRA